MNAVLLALLVLQSPVDEGTLVVREDTVEIAREAFRLTAVRTGAAWQRVMQTYGDGARETNDRFMYALYYFF